MSIKIPQLTGTPLSSLKARGKVRDFTKFDALMKAYQGTDNAYPLNEVLKFLDMSLYTLRSYCKIRDVKVIQRTSEFGEKLIAFE